MVKVSLFVAGAILGEVPMLLFVAGTIFGEGQVITFCGRCSTWWRFECKIGRETLYFRIENAPGELEK